MSLARSPRPPRRHRKRNKISFRGIDEPSPGGCRHIVANVICILSLRHSDQRHNNSDGTSENNNNKYIASTMDNSSWHLPISNSPVFARLQQQQQQQQQKNYRAFDSTGKYEPDNGKQRVRVSTRRNAKAATLFLVTRILHLSKRLLRHFFHRKEFRRKEMLNDLKKHQRQRNLHGMKNINSILIKNEKYNCFLFFIFS